VSLICPIHGDYKALLGYVKSLNNFHLVLKQTPKPVRKETLSDLKYTFSGNKHLKHKDGSLQALNLIGTLS
jgi:hypothetical protein